MTPCERQIVMLGALSVIGWVPTLGAQVAPPPAISLTMHGPDRFVSEVPVLVSFVITDDAYVLVLRVDTDGRISFVYPTQPAGDTLVPVGEPYDVIATPDEQARTSFVVDEYPGVGYLFAIASEEPLALDRFAYRGRWNRHALAPEGRVRGDPYAAFTDLVDRLLPEATGSYGYDVLPYTVGARYEVPRFACYGCHTGPGYPWRDDYRDWCATFRIDVVEDLIRRFPDGRTAINTTASTPALPTSIYVFTQRDGPAVQQPPRVRYGAGAPRAPEGLVGQLLREIVQADATRVRGSDHEPQISERPTLERRRRSN